MFEVEIVIEGVSKKYRKDNFRDARKMARMLARKLQIDVFVRKIIMRFDLIIIDRDGNRIIVAERNVPERQAYQYHNKYDWYDTDSVCMMWPSGWPYPDFGT